MAKRGRKTKKQVEKERGKLLKNKKTKTQDMQCKECGAWQYDVPGDIIGITCAMCVQEMVGLPEDVIPKVKRPPGWHFRKVFVDAEGNVFHKGVEQPDLKGTLDPTKIEKKKSKKKIKKKNTKKK